MSHAFSSPESIRILYWEKWQFTKKEETGEETVLKEEKIIENFHGYLTPLDTALDYYCKSLHFRGIVVIYFQSS